MDRLSLGSFESPRFLVHRHAQRRLRAKLGVKIATDDDNTVAYGIERLRSYNLPGIQGRPYTIRIEQTIKDGEEKLETEQSFTGIAARFKLPETALHSIYPPQGHEEPAATLPSIVFTDPTFPWERAGSAKSDDQNYHPPDYSRNRTPWLALLVFAADELKLPDNLLKGPESIFADVPSMTKDSAIQGPEFSTRIPTIDVKKIKFTASPILVDETGKSDDSKNTDIILVKKPLFQALFSKYDRKGNADSRAPYVYHHRFLAHKRVVNTKGTALSYVKSDMGESGSFGVIYSHRTGPTTIAAPTPVFVHLVSIEGVEQMDSWPLSDQIKFVAMSSLYSWSYVCQPPGSRTTYDDFVDLGHSIRYLAPNIAEPAAEKLQTKKPNGPIILDRLSNGYVLQRYRTQTGEMTSCLMRGPLVPRKVTLPEWWKAISMTGHDLNILDQDLGIMDITYAAAWNLGRVMAIADQAFTAALGRVRRSILDKGKCKAQAKYAQRYGIYKSKNDLVEALEETLERLAELPNSPSLQRAGTFVRRWSRPSKSRLDLSYHGDIVDSLVDEMVLEQAFSVAGGYQLDQDGVRPQRSVQLYDEYNIPNSTDWVVVLRWLLDRMFLEGIPSHYLIPDASELPLESLRFWIIDDSWMASFIDGALSLCNHVDQRHDCVRNSLKEVFQKYLNNETSIDDHHPPIPRFGCYIRSGLIKKFPDMQIVVVPQETLDNPPILIKHVLLDEGVMLCLFSETPSAARFQGLRFIQPPHQQTFEAGIPLTDTTLKMTYSPTYTHIAKPADSENTTPIDRPLWKKDEQNDRGVIFLWNNASGVQLNTLLMENYATDYLSKLKEKFPKPKPKPPKIADDVSYFDDDFPTAALMGFQQSSRSNALYIDLGEAITTDFSALADRSRYVDTYKRPKSNPPPLPADADPTAPYKSKHSVDVLQRRTRQIPLLNYTPSPNMRIARFSTSAVPSVPKPKPSKQVQKKHVRNESTMSTGFIDSDFSILESDMNKMDGLGPPQYNFKFWSSLKPGTPDNPGAIPALSGVNAQGLTVPLSQDIIFSITLDDPDPGEYFIERITIWVLVGPTPSPPVGGRPPEFIKGPLTVIDGRPSAMMLSNLRFNPRVSYTTHPKNNLEILLLPRGRMRLVDDDPRLTSPIVPVRKCRELSFMLSNVRVNLTPKGIDEVRVFPEISIRYRGTTVQPAKSTYMVVRKVAKSKTSAGREDWWKP